LGRGGFFLAGFHYNPNVHTLKQAQNPAKLRILFSGERFIKAVPAHAGHFSELFDVLCLHDGLDCFQNTGEIAFLKRLRQILGDRH